MPARLHMTAKTCTKCKETKSTELFGKKAAGKNGLKGQCKACRKLSAAKYYEDNKAEKTAYYAEYYQANKAEIAAKGKEYREDNKAKLNAYHKEYYLDNKAELDAKSAEYAKANKVEKAANNAKWAKANQPIRNAHEAKRRAKKLQQTPAWYASEDKQVQELYKQATELGLHVDHIVPLNNKLVSGLHTIANLQLLTPTENIVKSNKFLVE